MEPEIPWYATPPPQNWDLPTPTPQSGDSIRPTELEQTPVSPQVDGNTNILQTESPWIWSFDEEMNDLVEWNASFLTDAPEFPPIGGTAFELGEQSYSHALSQQTYALSEEDDLNMLSGFTLPSQLMSASYPHKDDTDITGVQATVDQQYSLTSDDDDDFEMDNTYEERSFSASETSTSAIDTPSSAEYDRLALEVASPVDDTPDRGPFSHPSIIVPCSPIPVYLQPYGDIYISPTIDAIPLYSDAAAKAALFRQDPWSWTPSQCFTYLTNVYSMSLWITNDTTSWASPTTAAAVQTHLGILAQKYRPTGAQMLMWLTEGILREYKFGPQHSARLTMLLDHVRRASTAYHRVIRVTQDGSQHPFQLPNPFPQASDVTIVEDSQYRAQFTAVVVRNPLADGETRTYHFAQRCYVVSKLARTEEPDVVERHRFAPVETAWCLGEEEEKEDVVREENEEERGYGYASSDGGCGIRG